MPHDTSTIRRLLKQFEFTTLFTQQLGWDHHRATLDLTINGEQFTLAAAAHKRGMVVFVCPAIPPHHVRAKIDQLVTKAAHEHIIIFHDPLHTTQLWQWTRREPGKPIVRREHRFHRGQPGDALLQKLMHIAFSLDEEDDLTIVDAKRRAQAAFDLDRVTKRFYDRFKDQHATFLSFISGIPDNGLRRWYASVMLNRLMFIYFIQRKGFLDGDVQYLRNHLARSREQLGHNKFYSFYRHFLLRLFHEGLGSKKRSPELEQLLGRIPYLNGGIFEQHVIEKTCPAIAIPDQAFEQVFDYFDQYQWHLDERPLRADNEINPAVLGYIFEKYINQKQMGAYYTKEDITEYISKNTILPFLLDAVRAKCTIAFENPDGHTVWDLLRSDPDRYIYDAVRRGVIAEDGRVIPEAALPDFVQKGMHDPTARMFDKRYNLGPAEIIAANGQNLALPTETWREYVARRQRCLELRAKLANGEVRHVNDLITYNLNIRQFVQDSIENSEGPELVRAFWHALENMSVLDPTCGSGAFLFAALSILEPLYEACLDRMESLVAESDQATSKRAATLRDEDSQEDLLIAHRTSRYIKYHDFRDILARVAEHPSPRYFIFKSIILNNLYGVDIMEEAVEICRLRLFLKLAAQVEPDARNDNFGIEPLPDIDFNIKAGNTLVGYATYEDVKNAIGSRLDFDNTMERIQQQAEEAERIFALFRKMQTEEGMDPKQFVEAKQQLRQELAVLQEELNRYLAQDYGIDVKNKDAYATWLKTHQPFHWFIEFYGIMKKGGFDVIIGNPPYVEYARKSKHSQLAVSDLYRVKGYVTLNTGNLYAFTIERTVCIRNAEGRTGVIVPVSIVGNDTYQPLLKLILRHGVFCSTYSNRPAKLFEGVEQRLAICLIQASAQSFTSHYKHWYVAERDTLFFGLEYCGSRPLASPVRLPKLGSPVAARVFEKILGASMTIADFYGSSNSAVFVHDGPTYWIRALPFEPNKNAKSQRSNHYRRLLFSTGRNAFKIAAVLNSSVFYFFYKSISNCRDLGTGELNTFRIPAMDSAACKEVENLGERLKHRLIAAARTSKRVYDSGIVVYEEYYPQDAKDIIDQIDQVLAKHYGFTDEELDYIINYDIKYRMGKEAESEE